MKNQEVNTLPAEQVYGGKVTDIGAIANTGFFLLSIVLGGSPYCM